jgi:hypothetical protein
MQADKHQRQRKRVGGIDPRQANADFETEVSTDGHGNACRTNEGEFLAEREGGAISTRCLDGGAVEERCVLRGERHIRSNSAQGHRQSQSNLSTWPSAGKHARLQQPPKTRLT